MPPRCQGEDEIKEGETLGNGQVRHGKDVYVSKIVYPYKNILLDVNWKMLTGKFQQEIFYIQAGTQMSALDSWTSFRLMFTF